MKKKQKSQTPIITKTFVVFSIIIILVAWYISYLWFLGKNSYEVYKDLKIKKIKLEKSIKALQKQNARLQKKFLDLKNLEPE